MVLEELQRNLRQNWAVIFRRQKLVSSPKVYADLAKQSCQNDDVLYTRKYDIQRMKHLLSKEVLNTYPGINEISLLVCDRVIP